MKWHTRPVMIQISIAALSEADRRAWRDLCTVAFFALLLGAWLVLG